MNQCSFCEARVYGQKLPSGWGHAKLVVGGKTTEVTFCPKHRKEAEKKLDLAFGK